MLEKFVVLDANNTKYTTSQIIKSPQSGVTLCFQFVSAAASASAAAAAAKTFASYVKTVWARLYIFRTKKVWVWENLLGDLWATLTQGHGCDIDKQKFAFLQDKVSNNHYKTL